ncbi:MAG: hypothetical protein RLZZ184_4228 [Cyanobacteriota bacterium]|jgi:hypothetical protein
MSVQVCLLNCQLRTSSHNPRHFLEVGFHASTQSMNLNIGIRFDSVNLLVWSGNREQGTGKRKDRIDTY